MYVLAPTGVYDDATIQGIKAFQKSFWPRTCSRHRFDDKSDFIINNRIMLNFAFLPLSFSNGIAKARLGKAGILRKIPSEDNQKGTPGKP